MQKTKNPKGSTLKVFAKRTILKTAQKAGLKKKDPNKNRYILDGFSGGSKDSRTLAGGSEASSTSDHFESNQQADSPKTSTSSSINSQPHMTATLPRSPMGSSSSVGSTTPHIKINQTSVNTLVKMAQMDYVKDYFRLTRVKSNFVKFLRACVPSAPESNSSLAKTIESLEWFGQLKSILECANSIVDLIDSQGKSVLLAIEEGWDLNPQITSIAQLCLDPYHRTFKGFRVLIEKEWLAFGQRFSHRSNHTAATPTSIFVPMFLQFLDLVHQILKQFPLSFEFNQYYLKFVAYHHVSCRFRTFLLDCEAERADVQINAVGISFWDYAERLWSQSPVFFNYYYTPVNLLDPTKNIVLKPCSNIAIFKLWDYYTSEELIHGPSYDTEVFNMTRQHQEELLASKDQSKASKRRLVVTNYDCIHLTQADGLTQSMGDLKSIEHEYNLNSSQWSDLWSKIETSLPVD